MKKHTKLELPRDVYRYRGAEEQISSEQSTMTPVVKLSWGDGIALYLQGAEYPQKTMASPEAMWACNLAKRNFVTIFKMAARWYLFDKVMCVIIVTWILTNSLRSI